MTKQSDLDPFSTLHKKAEEALNESPKGTAGIHSKDEQELLHELSVYRVELEMQNDELRRAGRLIEESRERYVDLYDFAPAGYLTFDEDGLIKELNLTAARLLGVDRRRLVDKPFSVFIHSDYQNVFYRHRQEVLRSTEVQRCGLVLKRRVGDLVNVRLMSVAARNNGDRSIRTILVDAADHKQPERQAVSPPARGEPSYDELRVRLEEAEQMIDAIRNGEVDAIVRTDKSGASVYTLEGPDRPYRNIVETMNAGAVTIDPQGTILYSNDAFSRMTDVPLEILMGSSFESLVIPEDRPLLLDFIARTHGTQKTGLEIRLKGRAAIFFVRLAGSSRTADGTEGTCIVITDISDLKSAEQSLRMEALSAARERDRLVTLVDSMNEGVWFANAEGVIMLANSVARSQAAEEGLDPDALIGVPSVAPWQQVEMRMPDGKPLDPEPFVRVFRGDPVRPMEIGVRNRTTGQIFHRMISANPILNEEGSVEGVITVVQDITAEKRAEEEKARLEEQLRQSQKLEAIGGLAGGIAHDFNNMLAVVLGNAEMALDEPDGSDAYKHHIEQIIKASKRARDLVRQILAFSRKPERERAPLRLTPLVKETCDLLRGSLPTTIAIELELEAGSDTVNADPSQIQQILMNLATNGAHAMRDNGGTLTISLFEVTLDRDGWMPEPEMSPGAYVELVVRDTGKGMTEGVRRRIFEPFFTTKPPGQGTGMGLAVVYGIVKGNRGAVIVESGPGKGSTFTVFLPLAKERAKEEEKEGGLLPQGRERLLLVDDEALVVEATSQTLASLGYEVTTASDGAEALDLFLDRPGDFDAVITDQTMPGITGFALAERILETRPEIPIILLTGYSETVPPEKAKAAGIREYVIKPVTKREIAKTVRRALDLKEPEN